MVDMVTLTRLDESRWHDYRDLRLEALKEEPLAFGSAYEEELPYSEADWRSRIKNVIFAMIDGKPGGMIVYVRNPRSKTNHILRYLWRLRAATISGPRDQQHIDGRSPGRNQKN